MFTADIRFFNRLVRNRMVHRGFHSGIGQAIGLVSALIGGVLIATGVADWTWALVSVVVFYTHVLAVTLGFHRLFSHFSYRAHPVVEFVLALMGTVVGSGSSIQWCVAHRQHHKYSDGPGDPHNTNRPLAFWLIDYYQPDHYEWGLAKPLMRSPLHMFLHRYYWGINFTLMAILLAISWKVLLFGYLIPMGLTLIMGGLHNVVAHWGDGRQRSPINLLWYAPFSMGEWLHKNHHDYPGRWDFSGPGQIDLGAWVLRGLARLGLVQFGQPSLAAISRA